MRAGALLVLAASLFATANATTNMVLAKPAEPRRRPAAMAMVLGPDNFAGLVACESALNFLSLYQGLITVRILLSWFPQAQGVALLRPVFTASDVYLNLFRGVIPPIGGLDISPIGAFFVLNLLTSGVASVGVTPPTPAALKK
uniref:YggT family protein n=1 Tax=Haptolina brevifila TaxID=156173 RepID=A0A7S2HUZ3_9EUKA|mmetsp:Transcript_5791/g.12186  ORF Transcript_5791/g.12186 Transcript_5791/m.12186 type:complete len:143 (+) Transcript_5791:28-456(+)|eukprot:CAMPEP_0174716162 /NCGR_PEP_ID=MMETSP1094-20130205/23086_1 /TAXON_ID=156173 /ORGANISM="Chrysochromulina brevifilum, Strain UTEX LB 985" /LENGTH=142 /DNA_ID=CAMNT_0015915847 /DNA_START=27 /DNA_END=455 /DNA_ORIENTATION=-